MTNTPEDLLLDALRARLDEPALRFLDEARAELRKWTEPARFALLLSKASRHAPRGLLAPTDAERAAAQRALEGWDPAHWTTLDAVRAVLVLARPDLAEESGAAALEEAFRYADEGEARGLFRTLPLLPAPERFLWRATDGCRTNMVSVFEAIACDSPYPARLFDELAWNQMVIKAVFLGVPLARVVGLDARLNPELARMALDLVEERRSAGRAVQPDLWRVLGTHGGARAVESAERELREGAPEGRRAALLALARAGARERLESLASELADPALAPALERALAGDVDQLAFAAHAPRETNR